MPELSPSESAAIDRLVARIEARTGVQIAAALVRRSDAYTELPWKAFALGASLASFIVVIADALRPQWVTGDTALVHVSAILLPAAAMAALAMFAAPFARLFLRRHRAAIEVRRYAESLFLRRRLYRTHTRMAALILISLFERRIEMLADEGLQARVSEPEWQSVIARMTPHLRDERPADALKEALDAVEALLVSKGCAGSPDPTHELPRSTIEETRA